MRRLVLLTIMTLSFGSIASAQSDYKMMAGVTGRILGPACVNCGLLYGGGVTFGYAATQRLVPTLDISSSSWRTKSDFGGVVTTSKTSALVISLGGDFYFKEAYKGFYVSPEVSFIQYNYKWNDAQVLGYPFNNVTVGLNMGWAISVGDRMELVPHFGYSTWFENSKGRVTMGIKLGLKF